MADGWALIGDDFIMIFIFLNADPVKNAEAESTGGKK